jgi:hypothetical protein
LSPSAPLTPLSPSEEELNRLFLEQFHKQRSSLDKALTRAQLSPPLAAPTAVSGTLRYLDDTGVPYPIRFALVQILNGATDALITETLTLADGTYSANVDATSIKVRVISEDGLRSVVRVNPLGSPLGRYSYTSAATTVGGSSTVVSFVTDQPIRGTPGVPSTDVISARAFSVLDALIQYQLQALGLRNAFMPQVKANFPNGTGSPCPPISCYSPSIQEMFILREDGLDWDVIGHEFFHFVTDQGASRVIDNNPGGFHSGGSAIGQAPCPGCQPRNRDEGMRLAWSEGLATFMSVRLQSEPAFAGFTVPSVPNVGDTHYQDTEDAAIDADLESNPVSQGFGSENSIMGLLWDFTDTPGDGAPTPGAGNATDQLDLAPKNIWDLINTGLPCNPCNRVDRFWTAILNLLSGDIPLLLGVAETPALNQISPQLVQPAHATLVSGGVSPIFEWEPNGDPNPAHQPNRFFLAISKDGFHEDIHRFPTNGQPIEATSHQIPDADYRALLEGATDATEFTWVVIGFRDADTDSRIPEGNSFFISNARTFTVRGIHVRLTWTTPGTDVDLHLRPPDGDAFPSWDYSNDCAFYNETPDWGILGEASDNPSLDRDCITGCTEENITLGRITSPGAYSVLAHYYGDHGQGPTQATVEIFLNGTLLFSDTRVLNNPTDDPDAGDLWTVLRVQLSPSGKVQLTGGGEVTQMSPSFRDSRWMSPAYLKP